MLNQTFVDDGIIGGQDFLDHTFCQQFFIDGGCVDGGDSQLIGVEGFDEVQCQLLFFLEDFDTFQRPLLDGCGVGTEEGWSD